MSNRTRGGAKSLTSLAPIFELDQFQYQSFVTTWLRKEVANDRSPTKTLMRVAGAAHGTAKNWLQGTATPNGLHLARLRASYPQFNSELRKLEGMERDLDPMFERALNEFIQRRISERKE